MCLLSSHHKVQWKHPWAIDCVEQITKDTMHQFLEPRHRDLAHALGQRRVGDDNSGRGLDVSDIPSGNINRIDPDPDAIAKMDRQWFNVLYNAPIKSVALLSSGLSQKVRCCARAWSWWSTVAC